MDGPSAFRGASAVMELLRKNSSCCCCITGSSHSFSSHLSALGFGSSARKKSHGRESENVFIHDAPRPCSCGWIGIDWGCLDSLFACDIEAQPSGFQVIHRVQASHRPYEQLGYTGGISQDAQKVRLVSVAGVLPLAVLSCRYCMPRVRFVPTVGRLEARRCGGNAW